VASALRSGLALVDAGWTGVVTVTIGAVVATVQPQGRMSAAAVWAYLLQESTRLHGGSWSGYVDSSDKLYIAGTAGNFTLAATGVTQTRLGLTGTYTGAGSYTADVAHYGAVTPSLGLRYDGGDAALAGRPAGATGALGSGGAWASEAGGLACYGTIAELVALEATLMAANVYDVWLDGRMLAKVHMGNVTRSRWGAHADRCMLTVAAQAVR
jgi:hypothetical protein